VLTYVSATTNGNIPNLAPVEQSHDGINMDKAPPGSYPNYGTDNPPAYPGYQLSQQAQPAPAFNAGPDPAGMWSMLIRVYFRRHVCLTQSVAEKYNGCLIYELF